MTSAEMRAGADWKRRMRPQDSAITRCERKWPFRDASRRAYGVAIRERIARSRSRPYRARSMSSAFSNPGLSVTPSDHVIDPVCGMTITRVQAPFTREHAGATYYLCSIECARRFDADGEAYVAVARLGLPGWGETPHPPAVTEQFRPTNDQA